MVREGSCKEPDAEFWLQIYTCMHVQNLARNPRRKPLATSSPKRYNDTDWAYQPGFAVYITLKIATPPFTPKNYVQS
jgi:hypothetical protein